MLRHWEKLTLFLRQAGAPLDNNVCERALKKAILHRKNALFYKTQNGARVGDLFMSLIYTCQLNEANPFDYLTELQRHADAGRGQPGAVDALELPRSADGGGERPRAVNDRRSHRQAPAPARPRQAPRRQAPRRQAPEPAAARAVAPSPAAPVRPAVIATRTAPPGQRLSRFCSLTERTPLMSKSCSGRRFGKSASTCCLAFLKSSWLHRPSANRSAVSTACLLCSSRTRCQTRRKQAQPNRISLRSLIEPGRRRKTPGSSKVSHSCSVMHRFLI